ncbi:MAG TPA: beta-propeller domain-containing protein [Thermoplasmata archaeon]|nr:beta-propeller domain-containing protein [Thermoplasmata archaeon]
MNSSVKVTLALGVVAIVVTGGTIAYALLRNVDFSFSSEGGLVAFSSYDELEAFIDVTRSDEAYLQESSDQLYLRNVESSDSSSYSTTNVQVFGVDEADTVKTDGELIYIVHGSSVMIVAAHPEDIMETIAVIEPCDVLGFEQGEVRLAVSGLYVWEGKLVVVANVYEYEEVFDLWAYVLPTTRPVNCQRAIVSVFDLADPSKPLLESSTGISGSHLATRMIDGIVYMVAQWGIYSMDGNVLIPKTWSQNSRGDIDAGHIYYDGETQCSDAFVNLMAVDVSDGKHKEMSVVTGYASTVYMSMNALYLTYPKWSGDLMWAEDSLAPEDESTTRTTIHKVEVDGLRMNAVATGEVRGWLLDQFSMDESGGILRVATTTSWISPENNVYVLSADMVTIGSLEGLAPTERIYASRFLGDTLYLVTFRQVDPLFVIDLSAPSAPVVLGELKVPGFSSYLHPISDGLVLGVGSQDGCVKLSLFDVSDPANPTETGNYMVEDKSWTPVSYDHKALLFEPARDLLVIPITTYDYTSSYTSQSAAWAFNVSAEDGISLWGKVVHDETDYCSHIERSLYIDDTLYTLSYSSIVASSLYDLSEMGALTLYEPEQVIYYYR